MIKYRQGYRKRRVTRAMAKERLDKIIASTGRWSRREVKELIRRGLVLLDGQPVRRGEEKADPETSEITVAGERLLYARFTYLMLHKPAGVLSATEDSRQETVLDLLTPELRRRGLFPVGRLDKDTEGLLLLTNDGPLAHRLLSPKSHVDKRYYVRLSAPVTEADTAAFAKGLPLPEGVRCLPALLAPGETPTEGFVTLHEGKFHQIKRMFLCQGKTVLYLKRLSMGGVSLDGTLERGKYRHLTVEEVSILRRNAGFCE